MIDLHCHILPQLDDGPNSIDESVALARSLAEQEVAKVVATPHVREDFPNTPPAIDRAVDDLRAALRTHGVPLEIVPGAEIAIDHLPRLAPADLRRLTLGDRGRYLLLETPYTTWPLTLSSQVAQLHADGFGVVLAHPERNPSVQATPDLLEPLVNAGVLVQITANSFRGRRASHIRETATALVARGLAHVVATDAHSAESRRTGWEAFADAVPDAGLRWWLTDDVPAAILTGSPPADRPQPARPQRRLSFRRARRG